MVTSPYKYRPNILILEDSDYAGPSIWNETSDPAWDGLSLDFADSFERILQIMYKQEVDVLVVLDSYIGGERNVIRQLELLREENQNIGLILFAYHGLDHHARFRCSVSNIIAIGQREPPGTLLQNILLLIPPSGIDQDFIYENKLFKDLPKKKELIIESPKIISDLRIVNKNYIDLVSRNPKEMYQLTPRQFEEFTAELFEKKGYKVKITPETKDGGKDLLILQHNVLGEFLIYTECKRYAPDNPVGVRIVRELHGTVMADQATAGIVVTSSYFSPEAKQFTEQVKHRLSLIDFDKLKLWIGGNLKDTR
jgi:HJR/Mrr/RecB family endonuclease